MAPKTSAMWSDASSSIYSSDDQYDPPMMENDARPLIDRSNSKSATSTRSTLSHGSTNYSEEFIKELGYRPFEYWKPPKSLVRKMKQQERGPPPMSPTLMLRLKDAARRKPSINSLAEFQPPPPARVLEVQGSYNTSAGGLRSPRVKDRYVNRLAQLRARRKREHAEWPGWVPDEKVLGIRTKRTVLDGRRMAAAGRPSSGTSTLLSSSRAANRERWSSPSTWQRRIWGILLSFGVLVLIAVGVLATVFSQGMSNTPRAAQPASSRIVVVEGVAGVAPRYSAPFSVPVAATIEAPRRLVARRFEG